MSSQRSGPSPPTSQESLQPLSGTRDQHSFQHHHHQPPSSSQRHHSNNIRPLYASDKRPGAEVVRPPSRGGGRGDRERPPPSESAKSFWSERVSRNPSEYTFYREPTPTPDENYEREKNDGAFPVTRKPGRSSTIALETAMTIEPPPRRPRQDAICGFRKRVFLWGLAGLLLAVLAIAVGVGVGVGMGKHENRVGQDPEGVSSSSLPSSATATSSLTSTSASTHTLSTHSSTSSASAKTTPTSSPTTDCPFVNNTIYQVPGSTVKFLRLCGIDYSGSTEAVALSDIPTSSFADCMDNCAGTYGCVACSWGVAAGDTGSEHECWMKSKLKKGHTTVSDWCFGVLQ